MNFACWTTGAWAAGSWVVGSWCPGPDTGGTGGRRPIRHIEQPIYDDDEDALILALMETLLND